MNHVTTASEFKGLIRHELDIESLLRTTLEFVLGRSGPTNAAVFLPTTSGDYSLGAYVNYDCPKDTVDILLDHMANVIAPRFEAADPLVNLESSDALDEYVGDQAEWLGDSNVAGLACRHEGETLAIVLLFRDRHAAFGKALLEQVQTVGELFAAQLARVIKVHHRHLPKHKWGQIGDPEPGVDGDDQSDLAA
jgi:hypothetical protein